jgi:hypothetical protein
MSLLALALLLVGAIFLWMTAGAPGGDPKGFLAAFAVLGLRYLAPALAVGGVVLAAITAAAGPRLNPNERTASYAIAFFALLPGLFLLAAALAQTLHGLGTP